MTIDDQVQRLRMLAVELLIGRDVGADRLIQAGLDALLAGVDSPSLRLLAGLTRREEPQARQLFDDTVAELDLAPALPTEPTAARWALVRWWAHLIATGELDPAIGGRLIWYEGWNRLDHSDALGPIVGLTSEYEDWTSDWQIPRRTLADGIVDEARKLLHGPWPPAAPAS
jgi:hypothetical protein